MSTKPVAPAFQRHFLACLYRQLLFIAKSPTAYIVVCLIPILLVGSMAVVEQMIFANSPDAKLAHRLETDFGREISTRLPTCASVPYDYLQKPCVDIAYLISPKFSDADAALLENVVQDVVLSSDLRVVQRFTDSALFEQYIGGVQRENDVLMALSFDKKSGSNEFQAVIHYSMMRYGPKLNSQMVFRKIDKYTDYFLPFSAALFTSFQRVANGLAAPVNFQVKAWPHNYYDGYKPITYFTGMIVTLAATSLILLLISMLLDDLSHPCTSLYAFLSISISARIASWLVLSLAICCAQSLMMYAVGVLFALPNFANTEFRNGIAPYLIFSLSLIPLALLITLSVTPNIRFPALPTTQPIITATYIVGLISIMTLIVLAPLSSTALKLADVHSSMSQLEGADVPLSVMVVGYVLRLFNLAIGVALCSLGVSTGVSLTSVKYSELNWLWIDMAWMTALSIIVLLCKLGRKISAKSAKAGQNAVEIINLTKKYRKNLQPVLSDVSLSVAPDERLFIIGNAGAGKSTLLHCINGIERRFDGSVACAKRIGFVSQYNTLWAGMSVENHIRLVLFAAGRAASALEQILTDVGLEQFPNRLARDLSFGMKRRLCLAMALAVDPEILILDEVSSGVDPVSKQLIHKAIQNNACCIVTTHDLQEAQRLASTLCFMSAGRIVERGPVLELFRRFDIRYQAQIYTAAPVDVQELAAALGRDVRDLGFGRYACDIDAFTDISDVQQRCSAVQGVTDCRLCHPSIDALFRQLCAD